MTGAAAFSGQVCLLFFQMNASGFPLISFSSSMLGNTKGKNCRLGWGDNSRGVWCACDSHCSMYLSLVYASTNWQTKPRLLCLVWSQTCLLLLPDCVWDFSSGSMCCLFLFLFLMFVGKSSVVCWLVCLMSKVKRCLFNISNFFVLFGIYSLYKSTHYPFYRFFAF